MPLQPPYEEYHPCRHRWIKIYPSDGEEPNSARFTNKSQPGKTDILAKPLCRRLLNLFLNHSEVLDGIHRSKLMSRLIDCGFTEEKLQELLEEDKRKNETRQRLADAGPFDVFDEHGNLLTPYYRKRRQVKKKKKQKKKENAGDHVEEKKCKKDKVGEETEEDVEDKRGKKKDKHGKDKRGRDEVAKLQPGWPHSMGVRLMLQACAFADSSPDEAFISNAAAASYFDVQASVVLDVISAALAMNITPGAPHNSYEKRIIQGCLNFTIWLAKSNMTNREGDIRKRSDESPEKAMEEEQDGTEEEAEIFTSMAYQRTWAEIKSDDEAISTGWSATAAAAEGLRSSDRKSNSEEMLEATTDPHSFLQLAKWYTPSEPEFMYGGSSITMPITCTENEGCEFWCLESVENMAPQRMVPNPIPQYFPQIRQRNWDIDSWYIIHQPRFYSQENFQWAMSKDANVEIIRRVLGLITTMIHTPNLSLQSLLEELREISQAIRFAEEDEEEEVEDEDQAIDEKRAMFLERLFLETFTSSFRDFNDETGDYMRTICRRGAVLVRHLYEFTAAKLWRLQTEEVHQQDSQSTEDEPSSLSVESADMNPDEDCEDWQAWVQFLRRTTQFNEEWGGWLNRIAPEVELPASRDRVMEEAEKWLWKGEQVFEYADDVRPKTLQTVELTDDNWSDID